MAMNRQTLPHIKGFHYWCLLLLIIVASCSTYPDREEICNPTGEVIATIESNYEQWTELVWSMPPSTNGVATFSARGYTYAVRVLQFTSDGQPILSVSTDEGHPRTWIGLSGYFITPGELLNLSSNYEIEHMKDNIYCYRKTTDQP